MTTLIKWAAIQIYYYLIAADGEICEQEMESFLEIAKATDPLFDQYKEALIKECKNQVNKIADKENCYAVIKEGIDMVYQDQHKEIISLGWVSGKIKSNMFLWNLLSIAMSDGTYADQEREIIEYVIEKFSIDRIAFLELESAMKAIQDIDYSIAKLSDKEKPFVIRGSFWNTESSETVEIIEEYTERRDIIFSGIKELIED